MSDLMYDSPLEFMQEARLSGECVAQSVIPRGDGTYVCACSCEQWETIAPGREEGLRLARRHTGSGQAPNQ
ncbi:hypothetical protein [Streptomyces sp. NPDC007264]|uniref:hypothetical protein n=1 Tax=Streptomyces sp. NPDC007264 TaxID=3364777 RepID=UPI0036DC62BF